MSLKSELFDAGTEIEGLVLAQIEPTKDAAVDALMKEVDDYVDEQKAELVVQYTKDWMDVRVQARLDGGEDDEYWASEIKAARLALNHAVDNERLLVDGASKSAFMAAVAAAVEVIAPTAEIVGRIALRAALGGIPLPF